MKLSFSFGHWLRAVIAMLLVAGGAIVAIGATAPTANAATDCKTKNYRTASVKTCVTYNVSARKFQLVFGSGVKNPARTKSKLSCASQKGVSKTRSKDYSASAEAGWGWGKVSGSVGRGLQDSVTAGYSVSVETDVPAGKTLFCDWGIYWYSWKGNITKTTCNAGGCRRTVSRFDGSAPARTIWLLSVGA